VTHPPQAEQVDAIRRFNRFYARHIGVVEERLSHGEFSLAEVRVLFELAQVATTTTAGEVGRRLGMDSGYLSRILQRLWLKGLLHREPSMPDRRKFRLRLTPAGKAACAPLDSAVSREISGMLQTLDDKGQGRLLEAMRTIMRLLDAQPLI
jgi:DNA-binding MarR family transcriptional regulator